MRAAGSTPFGAKAKMKGKKIVIKKYGNRRLYDTTNSAYINQDEVAQMVREGLDIQVVDAETGEDLTRLVLTQIIVQDAKESDSSFPLDILRQMVVAGSKVTQETTVKYMQTVLDMYQNAYRAMTPPVNPFEFMHPPAPRPADSPVPWSSPPPSDSRPGATQQHNTKKEDDSVGDLKRRVEELTSLVSRLSSKKDSGKRKRKAAKKR
jgi:polyhydroxyalkanoate synthesis repressor PhaR